MFKWLGDGLFIAYKFARVCQKMRQCKEYKNTEGKEQKITKNPP